MATDKKTTEYEVGNCKPPKEHQFKPGNQAAKRKRGKVHITTLIRQALQEVAEGDKHNRTYAEILAKSLIANAIKGNGTAMKELLARVDGAVPTKLEHTGKDGEPIQSETTNLNVTPEELKRYDAGELARMYRDALAKPEASQ